MNHDCKKHKVTCGNCHNSWCERCDPCPSAQCHWCNGRGHSTAPLNPGPPMMTVRVIDREASNKLWGTSQYRVIIKEMTIDAICPTCGEIRGEPETKRFYETGDWHTCDIWDNPCGHIDKYRDVLKEHNYLP